jgi:hypothetical protein
MLTLNSYDWYTITGGLTVVSVDKDVTVSVGDEVAFHEKPGKVFIVKDIEISRGLTYPPVTLGVGLVVKEKVEPYVRKTTHPQVDACGTMVDEKLAPLLKAVWANNYRTNYSCQGDPGYAYILFADYTHAQAFMQRTINRLINPIPHYYAETVDERSPKGTNVLCAAGLSLWPMDPDGRSLRGSVQFNPSSLQRITELWVDRHA